jgi:signal transduction histidine kinase/DNA-binding response OmpR family regulator
MEAPLSAETRQLRHEDAGLGDLRGEALRSLLVVFLASAFVILLANGAFVDQIGVAPAYVALALAGVSGAAAGCLRWGVRLASGALVAGLVGVVALAVALIPSVSPWAALGVPVLVATVLLGASAGAAALVLGSGLIGVVVLGSGAAGPGTVALTGSGLGGLMLACSIVLWRAFYTVLDWSWTSYEQAQRHASELRERQGELGRLNQSLVLAYEQLKQVTGQLERARQSAEEARRLKSEFAASVSHELRTPLNLIIGLSELMVVTPRTQVPLPELYRADVEAIYRNACHISNLIDDVLDLSQVEAHRMGLLKEWTPLRRIVDEATATVRTLFENTGLTLSIQIPTDLPSLFVDPIRIRQILINLLNNAVRFTEEGGVTISARLEATRVVVDVADTGVGIAVEDLPGVFTEFWRSGEPRRGRRGSGLGLAVSKRFAELHGGNMWVTSERGRGSTFSLEIPLGDKSLVQDANLDRPRWQRLEQQVSAQPTILLLDPDADTLRVFRRYLDGYQVLPAPTASSVARFAGEKPVRAIVVRTAEQRDAVRRALEHAGLAEPARRFPIVSCALRTSAAMARGLAVSDYLVKPVGQPELRRALRRHGRGVRDILVVDDDPEMLHVLTRMIGALAPRCHVRVAADGWQAIDLLQQHPSQVVFLDLLMPGLDGYGVIAHLRRTPGLEAIPVVVITARGAEDDGLSSESLELSQSGGIHAGELIRWLRGALDPPRPPDLPTAAPALPEALLESPVLAGSR